MFQWCNDCQVIIFEIKLMVKIGVIVMLWPEFSILYVVRYVCTKTLKGLSQVKISKISNCFGFPLIL